MPNADVRRARNRLLPRLYDKLRHERVNKVRHFSDFAGELFPYLLGSERQKRRDLVLKIAVEPNQVLSAKPNMKARYETPEWTTWLDAFDVGQAVRSTLIFVRQSTANT